MTYIKANLQQSLASWFRDPALLKKVYSNWTVWIACWEQQSTIANQYIDSFLRYISKLCTTFFTYIYEVHVALVKNTFQETWDMYHMHYVLSVMLRNPWNWQKAKQHQDIWNNGLVIWEMNGTNITIAPSNMRHISTNTCPQTSQSGYYWCC